MFQLIIFILNMKRELENKRKVIELSLQEITFRSDNRFTMQCYNTVTDLRSRVISLLMLQDK
jgi:hypothetical protein